MKRPDPTEQKPAPGPAAEKLRAVRLMAGLSLAQLAERLGMPLGSYRHYEERLKDEFLPVKFVRDLARALAGSDVPVEAVFALAGQAPPPASVLAEIAQGMREPPPKSYIARALEALDQDEAPGGTEKPFEIQFSQVDGVVKVAAVIRDPEGFAKLRATLDALEALNR